MSKTATIRKHGSLRAKMTAALIIAATLPLGILATYSYHEATNAYQNTATLLDIDHMEKAAHVVTTDLDRIPDDLSFLASFYDLKRYLLWHDIGEKTEAEKWLKSTRSGFHSFMQSNPLYMQLQVIDTEGMEIIDISRHKADGEVHSDRVNAPKNLRQSDYFAKAMQLPANKFYVSPMRLMRMHGAVIQPHVPLMDYALPLMDDNGTRHGVIVLRLFGEQILNKVQKEADTDTQENDGLYVVNQHGDYLSHPDSSKTFSFDQMQEGKALRGTNIARQNPQLWQAMQDGRQTHSSDDSIYAFKRIHPLKQQPSHFWYIIHASPKDVTLAALITFQRVFFAVVLLLLLGILIVSRPLIKKITAPIRQITANMQRLEQGETGLQSVQYQGHDELGDLVKATQGMSMRMTDAIKQANTIADGDFRAKIIPRSEKDELGIALQSMIQTLQNITAFTTSVAAGDLSQNIDIKGPHDQLGHAINTMIGTKRNIVKHANAIARGDFSADVEVRGEFDELGRALRDMNQMLRDLSGVAAAIATGDYSTEINPKGERDQLGRSIVHMTKSLRKATHEAEEQDWLKSGLADISREIQGIDSIEKLADTVMQRLAPMLNATHATFYTCGGQTPVLELKGQYACAKGALPVQIAPGEGLTGQCAQNKTIMIIDDIPDDYVQIQSTLGGSQPKTLAEIPLLADTHLAGVIELASLSEISDIQKILLQQLAPMLGMAVHALQQARQTEKLLEASQALTEELQTQEEELREANAEMEAKTEELSTSETELQAQQEELRLNNEQLIEKNKQVEAQKEDLTASSRSLAEQAEQLRQASQYKSDFLANMSHELRTPLNSLLILSDMLAKNKDENLTDKQVEFARTIYASGTDLLELINSILDLAKVEAGKMQLDPLRFPLQDISDGMQRDFAHVAKEKNVGFRLEHANDIPETLFSDAMRIKQVLKNLLSNAFKFTGNGEVVLDVSRSDEKNICFAISDTGPGIAADKLNDIFEAFQQEDGSTTRKYGGTGLGLSICKELAKLLGGHVTVQSEQDKGSTFSMIIPIECDIKEDTPAAFISKTIPQEEKDNKPPNMEEIPNPLNDDRDNIKAKDQSILIIEDDDKFARIQQSLVQERGFKAINALRGDHGMMLAQHHIPDAILLDLQLPVLDGISILDRLKQHPKLRHIPVHVISCMNKATERKVLQAGALSFIQKPAKKDDLEHVLDEISSFINKDVRHLLIVEDEKKQLLAMEELLTANDVDILTATTGKEALKLLRETHVDCMILDLTLPDMSGEKVLETMANEGAKINQGHVLPVIVHTGKELSEEQVEKLQGMSKSIVVKGSYSPDRLVAETSLFLHQIEEHMPEDKQQRIGKTRQQDVDISGKTVLLVDDDIRNVYSLSSFLEGYGLSMHTGRNGIEALAELEQHGDDIDLILMDIMMPEMDGYEAMREIRKINAHKNLPVIALTAKAMKGDREACIAAGASDYITKPVDTDKLISLMRVWLHE
ncbi:MAG: response regulator [Mariprofundaceae bacterium]